MGLRPNKCAGCFSLKAHGTATHRDISASTSWTKVSDFTTLLSFGPNLCSNIPHYSLRTKTSFIPYGIQYSRLLYMHKSPWTTWWNFHIWPCPPSSVVTFLQFKSIPHHLGTKFGILDTREHRVPVHRILYSIFAQFFQVQQCSTKLLSHSSNRSFQSTCKLLRATTLRTVIMLRWLSCFWSQ